MPYKQFLNENKVQIYEFKSQHLFGTLFALLFWSDADYALFVVLFGINLH